MGFVKGTLVFFLASFLLIALIFGNLALTLSLSIGQENFQENLVENIAKAVAENTETDEQIDSNLAVFQENCANNTEINLELNGTKISIPCEKAKEGSEAVIKESVNDILFETEPDKNIECDNSINCFLKYKGILFSEEAKNYWSKMFYFSLVVVFLIILGMFFLVEERLSLPISVGIITIISSLPFFPSATQPFSALNLRRARTSYLLSLPAKA